MAIAGYTLYSTLPLQMNHLITITTKDMHFALSFYWMLYYLEYHAQSVIHVHLPKKNQTL